MTLLLKCLTFEDGTDMSDSNYQLMLGKTHVGEGLKLRIFTDCSF
jgi:hypothetical protein